MKTGILKGNAKDGPNCDVTNNNAAWIIEISRQLCHPHHPQNRFLFAVRKGSIAWCFCLIHFYTAIPAGCWRMLVLLDKLKKDLYLMPVQPVWCFVTPQVSLV